jgi:hypothetical protein
MCRLQLFITGALVVTSVHAFLNLKDQDFTKPSLTPEVLNDAKQVQVLERWDTTTFANDVGPACVCMSVCACSLWNCSTVRRCL